MTIFKKSLQKILLAALALVDSFFISKIKSKPVQNGLRLNLEPVKQSVIAFTDDNPRNEEQLEAIWKSFANTELPDYSQNEIHAAIQKVEDADVREVLETISMPTVNLLRIVTDEDPNNKEQIRAMFNAFVKSPATQQVAVDHILVPLIESKVKDEALRMFLLELITSLNDMEDVA